MKVEPVLVYFVAGKRRDLCQSSGMFFSSNLALTTGFILHTLAPLPEYRKWLLSFLNSISPCLEENDHFQENSFIVTREITKKCKIHHRITKSLVSLETKVVGVWTCPLIQHSQESMFSGWYMGNESIEEIELSKRLMSVFILLECKVNDEDTSSEESEEDSNEEDLNEEDLNENLREDLDEDLTEDLNEYFNEDCNGYITELINLYSVLKEPIRGKEVEIISTPFGVELFFNSLSRGIVSNVVGAEKCCILTDARAVAGCEGAPIFAGKKSRNEPYRRLIGLVACSFSWCRGEWVGLTIGYNLTPILKRLLEQNKECVKISRCLSNSPRKLDLLPVDETVVLIRSDNCWSSGVVVDAVSGTILTCSHAVTNVKRVSIFYKNHYIPVTVIYKTPRGLAYDLAVLRAHERFLFRSEIKISHEKPRVGEVVVAAGFPFFTEENDTNLRPSLVCGCIARVNPYMIQTTCCIQSGFSGGAILRNGKMLGIITCYTKENTIGGRFPHINFAVPALVFKDVLSDFLETNNRDILQQLISPDPRVQALWELQSSKF